MSGQGETDISWSICQPVSVAMTVDEARDQRADEICRAAVGVFAAQGFRKTSMADLAAAAGVSRPALYQYFDNRSDLFRAAFRTVLEDGTDAALAALRQDGTLVERVDGYLQRLVGDAYEAMAATPFGDELMEAKYEFAADVAAAAIERARKGLRKFIGANVDADRATKTAAIELLILSPNGLKSDDPSPATYRRRLSTLARAATATLS